MQTQSPQERLKTWTDLAKRSQRGDEKAHLELLQNVLPYVELAIKKRMRYVVDTDEIVHSTVVSVHHLISTINPKTDMASWLKDIIDYEIDDFLERQGKEGRFLIYKELVTHAEKEMDSRVKTEGDKTVKDVFSRLPPSLQNAIKLTRFEKLTVEQAATKEGCPVKELERRRDKAYELLSKWIIFEVKH